MEKLESTRSRRWGVVGALLLSLAAGCSSSGGPQDSSPVGSGAQAPSARADEPGPGAPAGDVVCPGCTAGGETSDFGRGAPPEPCARKQGAMPLSEAEARSMGFGAALDAFAQDASASLMWTPGARRTSPAPSGYSDETTLTLSTQLSSLALRPAIAGGCPEQLFAVFDTHLSTADGALSIGGPAEVLLNREFPSWGSTRFDLTTASGSLRVSPRAGAGETFGFLSLRLYTWPQGTRGQLELELVEITPMGFQGHSWDSLLEGAFPADGCGLTTLPLDTAAPTSMLADKSPNQVHAQFAAILAARSPALGSWSDGTSTSVSMSLGAPGDVCVSPGGLHFQAPVAIRSLDMRVNLETEMRSYVHVQADGSIDDAWIEHHPRQSIRVQELNDAGISGLALDPSGRVQWHTGIYLGAAGVGGPHGKVVVQAVSSTGGVGDDIKLTWSMEP